jgi:hypothetical protein
MRCFTVICYTVNVKGSIKRGGKKHKYLSSESDIENLCTFGVEKFLYSVHGKY